MTIKKFNKKIYNICMMDENIFNPNYYYSFQQQHQKYF